MGALLLHAAVVARELGILAVVSYGNAAARLRTADGVWMDGTTGVVQLVEAT